MLNIPIGRRTLLRGAAQGAVAFSASSYSRILGANDRILMGVVGPGERGRHVMSLFQTDKNVEVAALCDIYAENIDRAKQKARNLLANG